MVIRKLRAAWRLLQDNPRALLDSFVRVDSFRVFSARPQDVPPPEHRPEIRIVRLTDEEMLALPSGWEQQTERFRRYGFHGAYGVYLDGQLAHINWLITADQDPLRRDRVIKLRAGEAEIAHGYTLPEFRRRGLQQLTIRALAQAASQRGIRKLYSITVADNTISMRGITSAGLSPCARAYRLVLAPSHGRLDIVIRGHRMPWHPLLKTPAPSTSSCGQAPATLSR
jgi:GNAT superfamily N-acetyltransferase